MRKVSAVVVLVLAGCENDAKVELDAAAIVIDSSGTVAPALCSHFVELETRKWRETLPYIEPTLGVMAYVDGTDFISLWGSSEPQIDGTTLVRAAKRYHFEDGSELLGVVGNRTAGDPMCEWVQPVRVE
jgi:hypothetical protein